MGSDFERERHIGNPKQTWAFDGPMFSYVGTVLSTNPSELALKNPPPLKLDSEKVLIKSSLKIDV